MKQLGINTLGICIIIFLAQKCFSQELETPQLGLRPHFKYSGNNILFCDLNKGEILNYTSISEPIKYVSIDPSDSIFYVLTEKALHSGNVNTGNIINTCKFKHVGIEGMIIPLAVNKNGRAVISNVVSKYDADQGMTYKNKILLLELDSRKLTELYDVSSDQVNFSRLLFNKDMSISNEGVIINEKKKEINIINLDSVKITKSFPIPKEIIAKEPELKDKMPSSFSVNASVPNIHLYTYFSTMNFIGFNTETKEVFISDYSFKKLPSVIGRLDDGSLLFSVRKCESIGDLSTCRLSFYKEASFENEFLIFDDANYAELYKNRYLLVTKPYEIELYDLKDQKSIWTIDTDF